MYEIWKHAELRTFTTLQDLYRFTLAQGILPPFSITSCVPRVHLSLKNIGNETIASQHVQNSVLMIESCENYEQTELDAFLGMLEVIKEVC